MFYFSSRPSWIFSPSPWRVFRKLSIGCFWKWRRWWPCKFFQKIVRLVSEIRNGSWERYIMWEMELYVWWEERVNVCVCVCVMDGLELCRLRTDKSVNCLEKITLETDCRWRRLDNFVNVSTSYQKISWFFFSISILFDFEVCMYFCMTFIPFVSFSSSFLFFVRF